MIRELAAVKRGAALLDERVPGWREKVNPQLLDLTHWTYCVLGQIFGSYDMGAVALEIEYSPDDEEPSDNSTVNYGFISPDEEYYSLEAVWLMELSK